MFRIEIMLAKVIGALCGSDDWTDHLISDFRPDPEPQTEEEMIAVFAGYGGNNSSQS